MSRPSVRMYFIGNKEREASSKQRSSGRENCPNHVHMWGYCKQKRVKSHLGPCGCRCTVGNRFCARSTLLSVEHSIRLEPLLLCFERNHNTLNIPHRAVADTLFGQTPTLLRLSIAASRCQIGLRPTILDTIGKAIVDTSTSNDNPIEQFPGMFFNAFAQQRLVFDVVHSTFYP